MNSRHDANKVAGGERLRTYRGRCCTSHHGCHGHLRHHLECRKGHNLDACTADVELHGGTRAIGVVLKHTNVLTCKRRRHIDDPKDEAVHTTSPSEVGERPLPPWRQLRSNRHSSLHTLGRSRRTKYLERPMVDMGALVVFELHTGLCTYNLCYVARAILVLTMLLDQHLIAHLGRAFVTRLTSSLTRCNKHLEVRG